MYHILQIIKSYLVYNKFKKIVIVIKYPVVNDYCYVVLDKHTAVSRKVVLHTRRTLTRQCRNLLWVMVVLRLND